MPTLSRELIEDLAKRVEERRKTNPSKKPGDDIREVVKESGVHRDIAFQAEQAVSEFLYDKKYARVSCGDETFPTVQRSRSRMHTSGEWDLPRGDRSDAP